LTDEQWEIIRPLIPVNQVGRPREVEMREVLNTIFYLNRSGCHWDMLPHNLLPWAATRFFGPPEMGDPQDEFKYEDVHGLCCVG
jgi:transposase